MTWNFVICETNGEAIAELSRASNRRITWQIDDAATASFDMDGRDEQTKVISELSTDLIIWFDHTKQFRGRLGSSMDDLDSSRHTCSFSAVDYRGMLSRRTIWQGSTVSFVNTEQGDIAWKLIDDTQKLGNLGITKGSVTDTLTHRDRTYEVGQNILQLLDDLGRVDGGYEWEIDADLHFNLWPTRGRTLWETVEYGRDVIGLRRNVDTSQFANAVRYSGADGVAAATAVATPGSEGRWEVQAGDTDLLIAANVTAKANWLLDVSSQINPSYDIKCKTEWWTPDRIWLGDTIRLICQHGRLTVDTTERVSQISVELDEDDVATTTLTIGPVRRNLLDRFRDYQKRLTTIERR
jgi:hypothetical protein